jgi:hypothetical protein
MAYISVLIGQKGIEVAETAKISQIFANFAVKFANCHNSQPLSSK